METEVKHETARIIYNPGKYEMRAETWSYPDTPHQITFIHVAVFNFGPRVLREMKKDWATWRPLFRAPVFVRHVSDDTHMKFMAMFGYHYLGKDDGGFDLYVSYPDEPLKD